MTTFQPVIFRSTLAGRRQRTGLSFALPAFVLFAVVLAYPIFESLRTSLFAIDLITGEADFAGLRNFAAMPRDDQLAGTLLHTLLWTVGSLAGQILLGLAAALLIDVKWRGMRWIRQLLLIPYVLPVIASALVWQWMLDGHYGIASSPLQQWGLLPPGTSPLGLEQSSLLTVIIVNIWRGFPFAMLVYWAQLQSVDPEQHEAARVDGAGVWQAFVHITLPHLRTATVALLALRGIWTLMYFELVWLLSRGGPAGSSEVLATHIYKVLMGEFRIGYAAALASAAGLAIVVAGLAGWLIRRVIVRRKSDG